MYAGATAGAASVLVSMPLECIKTVIDTRGSPAEGLATVLQFWATGRSIVAANGCGALYRGLSPALVRVCIQIRPTKNFSDGQRPV
jgi:Mitochondrial carrier protein